VKKGEGRGKVGGSFRVYPGARQWRIWRMAPRTFCPCQHEFNPVGTDGRGSDRSCTCQQAVFRLDCRDRMAARRGRSSRMAAGSPLQMSVPKKRGMAWILFKRILLIRQTICAPHTH